MFYIRGAYLSNSAKHCRCQHFENDARLPYSYVPTNRDLVSLKLALSTRRDDSVKDQTVVVIGHGYWLLPWYLRMFNRIGYWDHPVKMIDAPLVFIQIPTATNALLSDSHVVFRTTHQCFDNSPSAQRPWTKWINNQP